MTVGAGALSSGGRRGSIMPDAHMKRMACQIAAQLPDDQREALAVLDYVREIVENLGGGWRQPEPIRKTPALYVIQRTSQEAAQAGAPEVLIGPQDKSNRGWRRSLFE